MLQGVLSFFSEPAAFFDQTYYRIIALLIGLCCHEWGHAYVAWRCGDDTSKQAGRLTLNPLAHLDPLGTLLMLFVGFGYAKPVPVNPSNYRGNRVKADLAVSFAGIMVNLGLFVLLTYSSVFISFFVWDRQIIEYYGIERLVSYQYSPIWIIITGQAKDVYNDFLQNQWLIPFLRVISYSALVNLNLAVFNLIPIPPLDGYHIVNDTLFKGKFILSPIAFRVSLLIVLILSAQGFLGRVISAVVYPAQHLLLLPFGGG